VPVMKYPFVMVISPDQNELELKISRNFISAY